MSYFCSVSESVKRSRAEVIMAILSAAREGVYKTRLMYKVNMNLASFNRYLTELMEVGLIVRVDDSGGNAVYRITERGESLLDLLEKAEEFISL